jgi:cell wall-associated NlpC family hydrolase
LANRRSRAALVVLLTAALVAGAGVSPAFAVDDYPSWADVEAAKHDEKAKKQQIKKIETLIDGLEETNASLARVALEVNESYNIARDALDDATEAADTLQAQSDAASATATESGTRAAAIIAALARTGTQDLTLTLLFNGDNADDLLYSLSLAGKISESSAAIYEQAEQDRNTADALAAQAEVAQGERKKLAKTAKSALNEAEAASDAAEASLTTQSTRATKLYDQLASLKDTTADVEKQYQEGLAWEKAQAAIKKAPVAPPLDVVAPAPSGDAAGAAIAFAQAQLGEPYVLGGAGPNVWDCSGLTGASYASVGVYIGTHSATNQYATMAAANRLLPLDQLAPGDLLFYSSGGSTGGSKYHTTMYIGNGQMIEAPYPGATVRIKPVRYGDLVPYAARPTP